MIYERRFYFKTVPYSIEFWEHSIESTHSVELHKYSVEFNNKLPFLRQMSNTSQFPSNPKLGRVTLYSI